MKVESTGVIKWELYSGTQESGRCCWVPANASVRMPMRDISLNTFEYYLKATVFS